jgi:polysaccharide export outer membrane protein
MNMNRSTLNVLFALMVIVTIAPAVSAQQNPARPAAPTTRAAGAATMAANLPPNYVIGPDDVLGIVFFGDEALTGDVVVRPDGKISVPLLHDIQAAGLTPEALRDSLMKAGARYLESPNATVVVRQINSRKVFITGRVQRSGPYVVTAPTTVLQLIALAGGLTDWAEEDQIVVMRNENGRQVRHKFNYKDVIGGKKLQQNIVLEPGDTIVVP